MFWMNIRYVQYVLIPIPKETLNPHQSKLFLKISFAVKCHLVFIIIYENQIKLKYLPPKWLILNHLGRFKCIHSCKNTSITRKLITKLKLSKPGKSNSRYDGFCRFPVIVAKSSDPDDVKD